MLSLAQEHFSKTKQLIEKVDKDTIADWFLSEGYFPEQYVLPPCFHVENFILRKEPYFQVSSDNIGRRNYRPSQSELLNVFFPKSNLTDRVFGIIEPKIYHDIVFHLTKNWGAIQDHLFHSDIRFYSYSFPLPVTDESVGELGTLRSGRMIYEFIEMAENNLVADSYKYEYFVETDIKNFYPSIYTHSIAWALHNKQDARNDKFVYDLFGTKLDKLFQNANDGGTNGLAIGPVISDLVSEIILAAIDRKCSDELGGIDFLAVRFKDDYKILVQSKTDADRVIKALQRQMRNYNLSLGEDKTVILNLPEGLYRPWIVEYQQFSLKQEESIVYKKFENTLLNTINIDKRYPGTGIIDKFLGELITRDYKLKLSLKNEQIQKTISLLFLLKKRRAKVFPQILAIIELIIKEIRSNSNLVEAIIGDIRQSLVSSLDYLYDDLWICYFLKSHGFGIPNIPSLDGNLLYSSIKENRQKFYNSEHDIVLFRPIEKPGKNILLAQHLAIFPKDETP